MGWPGSAEEAALERPEITGFRFHDLRHTAATWWAMQGVPLYEVQALLGHADPRMTQRYAHLAPGHLRSAVASLKGYSGPNRIETVDRTVDSEKAGR